MTDINRLWRLLAIANKSHVGSDELANSSNEILDALPKLLDELTASRQRIKDLERLLVEKMDEALKQLPPLADQHWMWVMKHKETP